MKLKPYQEHLIKLAAQFEETGFAHLSRNKNQFADALGTLALMTQIGGEVKIQPVNIEIKISPAYCCCLNEMEEDMKPWYHNIQQFIRSRDYTARADKTNRKYFRIMTMHCYLEGEILYKRGFDGTPLRYLDKKKALKAMEEIHEGVCAMNMMLGQIQSSEYFWTPIKRLHYLRVKCHKCQVFVDKINTPP